MKTRPYERILSRLRCRGAALFFCFGVVALDHAQGMDPSPEFERVAESVRSAIEHELSDKDLRAISIALVDDQRIAWAQGFGYADPKSKIMATPETIYRVGSVSKLFTDIGVMQLVERDELDLDTPIQTYLPEFRPNNPFDQSMTLRQLMAHRGGLVREPPLGNYFDSTGTSLADTVASLNKTSLVFQPGEKTKYSNAGIAVVGYVLQRRRNQPFAKYLQRTVLAPMGLDDSSFEPSGARAARLASGEMWSYDGRRFEAPLIQLGMAPAGSMYSTVLDLGRFISVLFNEGRGANGQVLQPETLKTMLTPQFAPADAKTGYGIGFRISDLDGHVAHGHGGAIYGFSTQLKFISDHKIGVVVISATDVTNAITRRIANHTLKSVLAVRRQDAIPKYETSSPVDPLLQRAVVGRYRSPETGELVELCQQRQELFATIGTRHLRVRRKGQVLWVDDRCGYGPGIEVVSGTQLRINRQTYQRQSEMDSRPIPDRWQGLVGAYGWDHNELFVFERDGDLHLLIEWVEIDRLTELGGDRFAFPEENSMYHHEEVRFVRDQTGRAKNAMVAGISFPRRSSEGESLRPISNPCGTESGLIDRATQ